MFKSPPAEGAGAGAGAGGSANTPPKFIANSEPTLPNIVFGLAAFFGRNPIIQVK